MRILLVEDEEHKRDEIIQYVHQVYDFSPDVVDGVRSAIMQIMEEDYDLIILDMALPTFGGNAADNNKGHDQAQGGIEVLRVLKLEKKSTKIIIVTQYPDFYIGGIKVKLKDSPKIIFDKYNQKVIGAVLYHYKSKTTQQRITSILRSCK
jgi:CheY-like chemotaxis protein